MEIENFEQQHQFLRGRFIVALLIGKSRLLLKQGQLVPLLVPTN